MIQVEAKQKNIMIQLRSDFEGILRTGKRSASQGSGERGPGFGVTKQNGSSSWRQQDHGQIMERDTH